MNLEATHYSVDTHLLDNNIKQLNDALGAADQFMDQRSGEECLTQYLNNESRALLDARDNWNWEGLEKVNKESLMEILEEPDSLEMLESEGYIEPVYNPLQEVLIDIMDSGGIMGYLTHMPEPQEEDGINEAIYFINKQLNSNGDTQPTDKERGELKEAMEYLTKCINLGRQSPIPMIWKYQEKFLRPNRIGKSKRATR